MAIVRHELYLHESAAVLAGDAKKQADFLFTAAKMRLDTHEEGQDMETNNAYTSGPRHLVLGLVRWARTRGIYPSEVLVDSEDDEHYFSSEFARDVERGRMPGGAGAAPDVLFG